MGFTLSDLKNEIKKSGTNKGKFLYFKEGEKVRVRFLTDMEDGVEVVWHDSYKEHINVPCQETFGRECKYCEEDELRTRNMYFWSVYDYESKSVKILMASVNQCSPIPALVAMYEEYGTLTDRDFVIKQIGSGTGKSFSIIPQDKAKFRAGAKPLSESAILKQIDKAYPDTEAEDEEDEEYEEKPKRNKKSSEKKTSNKKQEEDEEDDIDLNEPEDEEEEWGEEEQDYENMKPQELYKLCKERGISCKSKKSKEYYIDLLESEDEADDEDWGE